MKTGMSVAMAVVAGVLGLVIGAYLIGSPSQDQAKPVEDLRAHNRQLQDEVDRLRRENGQILASVREAEQAATDREKIEGNAVSDAPFDGPTASEIGIGTVSDAVVEGNAAFYADKFDGVIRTVNWEMVGKNLGEMAPLISEIARALIKQEPPSRTQLARLQQLNGPLLVAAVKASEKLSGTGVNGAFSHPAFMLNAISSTLELGALPLSEQQAKILKLIGDRYLALDEKRLSSYAETTYDLQKLYEEAEQKDLFFDEVFRTLTPSQEALLRSDETKGRVRADLFSSSLLYVQRIDLFGMKNTGELKSKIVTRAGIQFTLTDEERQKASTVIEDWIRALPRDMLEWEPDTLDKQGILDTRRVTAWARETLNLTRQLVSSLGFTGDRFERARSLPGVLFPLPTPERTE